ncbi:MAG: hypothetical protein RLZZ77_1499 [Bacteroidota bacterium]|jgi:hypothetical protein
MKKTFSIALLTLTVILASSCNNCDDAECSGSGLVIPINVLRIGDDSDLFDGETGIYNAYECSLYRLSGSDTIFFTVDYSTTNINTNDSVVLLHVDARYFDYYFEFSDGDVDTLSFRYNTSPSECCGAIYDQNSLIWNGRTKYPSNDAIRRFTIRK